MSATRESIARAELHKLVWSTPIVRIARDMGCSDVAIAKLCKKLDVPRRGAAIAPV